MTTHLKIQGENSALCGLSGIRLLKSKSNDEVTCKNCLKAISGESKDLKSKKEGLIRTQKRVNK